MTKHVVSIAAVAAMIFLSRSSAAAVPDMIPVQGVLADSTGAPVDALTDMTFTLYDGNTSTTVLWTEDYTGVDVDEGFFTVYLGENLTNALDFESFLSNSEIWLGITVGTDPEMDRILLVSVPFAQEALVCGSVGSLTESDINSNFMSSSYVPSWLDLTGVPTDFSDNVDDVDDTVDWSEIGGLVGTTSSTVAAGDHSHDSDYMSSSSAAAAIGASDIANWNTAYGWGDHSGLYAPATHNHSWSDITSGMPAGFADGVDNDTTYSAGSGLTLGGTNFYIATAGITSTHLAANSVYASEIATNAVGAPEIATNAVGAPEIAANAVGASEIAADAVGTSEIIDGSIQLADLDTANIFAPSVSTFSQIYQTIDTAASAGGEILLSQSITVPAAGTVLAVADAGYRCNNCTSTTDYAFIHTAITTASSGAISDTTDFPAESLAPFNAYETPRGNLSVTRVFSVSSGTTTFYLRSGTVYGVDMRIGRRHMSLIYIPN